MTIKDKESENNNMEDETKSYIWNEMEFYVWNVFTNLNEFDYENVDILVEPLGDKKEQLEEMVQQEMRKLGFTDSRIEHEMKNGTLFVNVIDSKEVDNVYSDGGFPTLNPEQESTLFFLTFDNYLVSTGYVFDEDESKKLQEFVSEIVREEKEKSKENIKENTDCEVEMD